MRPLFHDLFHNLGDGEVVHRQAVQAARELEVYLAALIEERREGVVAGGLPANVLGHMIYKAETNAKGSERLDADGNRRSITGVIIGAVDATNKGFCLALDQLLRWPKALQAVAEAAQQKDMETVHAFVYEAMRFNPHNPIIVRTCADWAVVAPGTARARAVAPNSRVFAMTPSAMFDGRVYNGPKQFAANRGTGHL
jgi:cytochrome P450